MVAYVENPVESMKKLLEVISEFSKIAGCTTNMQKSISLSQPESEIEIKHKHHL